MCGPKQFWIGVPDEERLRFWCIGKGSIHQMLLGKFWKLWKSNFQDMPLALRDKGLLKGEGFVTYMQAQEDQQVSNVGPTPEQP